MQNFITLNNSQQMPSLGLGTWRSLAGSAQRAVKFALEQGYRHIDCASIYQNEKEIGAAFNEVLTESQIKREELFVTSKLWCTDHHPDRVERACRQTLADLQLDYLDLYLMHWGVAFESGGDLEPLDADGVIKTAPVSTQATWQAMEQLVHKGLVKAIGVANFTTAMLIDLLSYAQMQPSVNQIEIHPYNAQFALVKFCQARNIAVTAYSPLGSAGAVESKPLQDQVVLSIAKVQGKTPAQILLRWLLQRGLIAIPKSIQPERILENSQIFDFTLSDEEMTQINQLDRKQRFVDPIDWWGIPYFA